MSHEEWLQVMAEGFLLWSGIGAGYTVFSLMNGISEDVRTE